MIYLRLIFIPYVVIKQLAKFHDWISLLDLINPVHWFDLISSVLWFDLISSIFWSDLIKSYFLIWFKHFDSTVIPFAYLYNVVKDSPNKIPENIIG